MVRILYWSLAIPMAVSFMAAVAITFGITATRYLIGFSDPTAEYLSRYFVILGTFIGFPVAVLHGVHVRFDLADYMLGPKARRAFHVLGAALSMAICAVFAYAAILFIDDSMLFGEIMPTGFKLPLWIPHASVALGMILGCIAYLVVILVGPYEPASPDHDDVAHVD